MAVVTIKLVNGELLSSFYFTKTPQELAKKLLSEGQYKEIRSLVYPDPKQGEDMAEEMFDLTNNPSREHERKHRYGDFRSLSVGDIVSVDGMNYLCASLGWLTLD